MSTEWRASVNLGPDRGVWHPRTWQDVVDAAAGGLLDESPWLDLKRELKSGKPGNNDLAVDAAAMALEGGMLLYDVEDHDSRAGKVVGVELAGMADRVDQVARGKIRPPLMVRSVEIEDPARPGWGCLLVIVPPSPQAPHMVDNMYYGRGDRGNRKLTDEDVRRELARRAQHHLDLSEQLRLLRDEDYAPHEFGHLYVIVQPLAARDDLLADFLTGSDAQLKIRYKADQISRELGQGWAPALSDATRPQRRADGLAFTSAYGQQDIREQSFVEVVVREDGGVALTCGRGTDSLPRAGHTDPRLTFPTLLLGLTHSALSVAAQLAVEVSGYQGQWSVGVLLDQMKGVTAHRGNAGFHDGTPYSRDEYEQQTVTSTVELVDDAPAVVQRLLGKLMRGLRVDGIYLPYSPEKLRKAS